jgi:L-aspartate oxidase
MIGGVQVDSQGRTSIPHLWGAGEVTSSGLHGANRLASNSLLEGLVYGALTGRGAADAAQADSGRFQLSDIQQGVGENGQFHLDLADVCNSLRSLMWRAAGVRRGSEGLQEANQQIQRWRHYTERHQFTEASGWELQNLLQVSWCLVQAAIRREESRGVHFRSDFPQSDDAKWLGHLCFDSERLSFEPLG